MNAPVEYAEQRNLVTAAIEAAIRIAVIGALAYWCLQILSPFVMPLVWGAIIAVAVYPAFARVERALKGRKGLAATVVTAGLLLLLLAPVLLLADTLVAGVRTAAEGMRDGTLHIPPPPEGVASWPVVGKQLAAVWTSASENLPGLVAQMGPAAMDAGKWLLSGAAGIGIAVLLFVVSVFVAGILLAYSESSSRAARRLATRLAGDRGAEYVKAAESTVRSVAVGILGIAFIQATLAGLGMLVAGIPGAGLWAFVCLILSITQIGGLPVLLPAAIYLFATGDTMPAVLFSIWAVVIGLSDNILKPLLLGRGTDAPMIVVLIGSIGGMVASGVVGLFVGAVILTLGYKLFLVWIEEHA
jgi:predicted PurR-regulated permease PerM